MEYLGAFLIVLAVILLFYGMNKKSSVYENFVSKSTINEVKSGASTFYDWSGGMKTCNTSKKKEEDSDFEIGEEQCVEKDAEPIKCNCENCDITKMPGIDKYILKSSVPPCPDMSNYAEKSMIKPDIDMSKYMLKTNVKPCKKCPDMSEYVHKSEIPAKVQCPKCPTCPICPICPDVNISYKKGYNDALKSIKKQSSQQQQKPSQPSQQPSQQKPSQKQLGQQQLGQQQLGQQQLGQQQLGQQQLRQQQLGQYNMEEQNTEEQRFGKMIEEQKNLSGSYKNNITGYNPSLMDFHAQFDKKVTNKNLLFGDRDNRMHNGLC